MQGVPGFYQLENGDWSVKFTEKTSGILIPAREIDGLIHGAQILLDVPIKDINDPPEREKETSTYGFHLQLKDWVLRPAVRFIL